VVSVAVAFVVFVLVWFQPQKALLTQRVSEGVPTVSPAGGARPSSSPATPAPPTATTSLAAGSFRSLEHDTLGRAVVLRLGDGSLFLRFEDFTTLNGPALHVYLSPVASTGDLHAYGAPGYLDLGPLKGNVGDQNYALPKGFDLSKFRSAVVWCQRFAVGFGVAPLNPV